MAEECNHQNKNNSKIKIFEVCFIFFLVILTCSYAITIFGHYNTASFLYDAVLYVNVADSLREGKGFTSNLILPVATLDANTHTMKETHDPKILMEQEPEPRWEYGKPPMFFLLLAGFFDLVSANSSNWIFYSAVFNTALSILFIVFYYYWSKKNFGLKISIISTAIIATSTIFIIFTTPARVYLLTNFFFLLSFFFLNPRKRDYFLFGVLAAFANLTHPMGITAVISYVAYLLYKKEWKGFSIVTITWFGLLLPWMLRQFYVFGDFGKSLGIPFSEQISHYIFGSVISEPFPILADVFVSIKTPFEMMYKLFFTPGWWNFNQEFIVLFLAFAVFSFVSLSSLKINVKNKNTLVKISLLSVIVILYLAIRGFYINDSYLIRILDFLFIIPLPIFLISLIKRRSKDTFETKIPRDYSVIVFLVMVSIVGSYVVEYFAGETRPELFFPMLFLSLPLGVKGILKVIEKLPIWKDEYKKKFAYGLVIILVIISASFVMPTTYSSAYSFSNYSSLNEQQEKFYDWIRTNIDHKAVLMGYIPTQLFIRTGNPVIQLPNSPGDYLTIKKYEEHYNSSYLIIDNWTPNIPQGFGFKNDTLHEIYGDGVYRIYKVDYSNMPITEKNR